MRVALACPTFTVDGLALRVLSPMPRASGRHSIAISGDPWPDDLRLSDIEHRFVCEVCGKRGADVRPDFNWDKKPVRVMGYR